MLELRSRLKGKENRTDSVWFILLTSLLISSFMLFQKQIFIVLYEHECVLCLEPKMRCFECCKVILNASSRKLHVCSMNNRKWANLVLANCFQ